MLRIKAVWLQQREERVPLVSSLVEQKRPQEVYAICGVKRLTSRFKGRKWKRRRQFSIPSSLFQRLQLVSGHLLHPGTGLQIPRGQHQEQPEFHADRHCCYACFRFLVSCSFHPSALTKKEKFKNICHWFLLGCYMWLLPKINQTIPESINS